MKCFVLYSTAVNGLQDYTEKPNGLIFTRYMKLAHVIVVSCVVSCDCSIFPHQCLFRFQTTTNCCKTQIIKRHNFCLRKWTDQWHSSSPKRPTKSETHGRCKADVLGVAYKCKWYFPGVYPYEVTDWLGYRIVLTRNQARPELLSVFTSGNHILVLAGDTGTCLVYIHVFSL